MEEINSSINQYREDYSKRLKFFKRPLYSNTRYKYKLVSFENPHNFHLKIDDERSAADEEKLKLLLQQYEMDWRQNIVVRRLIFTPDIIYTGMPLIQAHGASSNPW